MTKGYRISASTGIHKGDRDYQQDQVTLLSHARVNGCVLAVVADGMGGRSGGRKASDQVMLTARQLFERFDPVNDDPAKLLLQIVQEAHMVIRLTAISSEQEPHSTIAAFLILPSGECRWAHAGDSRIYHFNQGNMLKRTRDHSYVQALVDRGEITEEEANRHPKSNILLGCLGTERDPPTSTHLISRLRPGDVFMACSDGLWHYFTDAELGASLAALVPREATEFLIEKARNRARGGGDNLCLVVVKLESLEPATTTPAELPTLPGTL
jgi:serine/threonine protein phosphatase PrpC